MPPEQGIALAELIGDVKPATTELLQHLGEAVRDIREHDHPEFGDLFCLKLVAWMGKRMPHVLRYLLDLEAQKARMTEMLAKREADTMLLAELQAAGVDNWDGYDEAMAAFRDNYKKRQP